MSFENRNLRSTFYKYASADTAKLIFKNQTFKWSSPSVFNDPFDTQAGLHAELDLNDLPRLMIDRMVELTLSEDEPVFIRPNELSNHIIVMRQRKLSAEQIREILIPTTPILQLFGIGAKKARDSMFDTIKTGLKGVRVLSLSEQYDNILMWSHYADFHKGVVIKIRVLEEIEADDALRAAQPIEYCSTATPIVPIDYVEHLLGLKVSPVEIQMSEYVKKKWSIWNYEKEWRLWTKVNGEEANNEYGYHPFNINIIDSIYFGCRSKYEDVKEIIEIVGRKKSNVKFFKASKHPYDYKLNFEEIQA